MANPQQSSVTAQLECHKLMVKSSKYISLLSLLIASLQLLASLTTVAQQMRQCATVAEQFAQTLTQTSFSGGLLPSPIQPEGVQAVNGNKRQGMEEDDIEGPTKKRRVSNKKAKDPDAPKRAA